MASLAERFWAKVSPEPNTGCWLWDGALDGGGYSKILLKDKKLISGHRLSYQMHKGKIPEFLELDHLCRVRCCVNPDHLEAVTRAENVRRGDHSNKLFTKVESAKTHCPQGHPYSGKNLEIHADGSRRCKTCKSARLRKWRARRNLRAV